MNIFVRMALEERARKTITQEAGDEDDIAFADGMHGPEQKEQFLTSDVAFGNVPAAWLEETDRLQWLQLESVGFTPYQEVAPGRSFTLTNLKGFFGTPVAETILAGVLALYRGVDTLVELKSERAWRKMEVRPALRTLHGQRAVILGSGSIGRALKRLLLAFSCPVTVFANSAPEADIYTPSELDEALTNADVVAACLPDTPDTRNLFDRRRLALLPERAVFVNVGRGSVVDEEALTRALQDERLGGAVLDVTREEPLPETHPLWHCPNTILTQHTAGGTADETEQKVHFFLDNLSRFRDGETLLNVVDFERGY
jgi:phosphoglycerate dehydrogenase-like enzyme